MSKKTVYVDSSVVLAAFGAEDKRPVQSFWDHRLVASRLTKYECIVRAHSRKLSLDLFDELNSYLNRIAFSDLNEEVLGRALEPFSVALRTLDVLHLATAAFLSKQMSGLEIATYDDRMQDGARALKLRLFDLNRSI